jgi:hypothetical protein
MTAQPVALFAGCQIPDDQGLVVRGRETGAAVGADGTVENATLVAPQTVAFSADCQVPDDQVLVVRGRKANEAVGADGAASNLAIVAAQAAQLPPRY